MAKKTLQTITIPIDLARLLAAESGDFKSTRAEQDARAVARASLRLLMKMSEK